MSKNCIIYVLTAANSSMDTALREICTLLQLQWLDLFKTPSTRSPRTFFSVLKQEDHPDETYPEVTKSVASLPR